MSVTSPRGVSSGSVVPLKWHLNAQIIENEENVARLRKAIADKQPPLMLAETRLDTRKNRPNVELCRDPVQYRLIEEVSSQSAETAPKLVGCLAEWVEEEG